MKIVCLGWGSLIWDPRKLKIKKDDWQDDGPKLPIELNRISSDKRITFIIDEKGTQVNVLWTLMTVDNRDDAIESLRKRECAKKEDINFVPREEDGKPPYTHEPTILKWLKLKGFGGAVWTGLPCKNREGEKESMSYEYIKNHLSSLSYVEAKLAEQYVRKAPPQIKTSYRKRLEIELGWTPIK